MMNDYSLIQQQDTETCILTISHLTDRLRQGLSEQEKGCITSQEEAINLLNALAGAPITIVDHEILEDILDEKRLKLLLTALWEDEAIRPELKILLDRPPYYAQRSFEELKTVAVVLGCLVAWLQTKVHFHIKRENGKTEFEFQILKHKTSDSILQKIITVIQEVAGRKKLPNEKDQSTEHD
ncbi:hypothetical protein [Chitinophaga filiformis]|uniref:Uncharacterized protein n=1 Tax=Chitinophaga filiformis TaxID=104663 RepID=A0ABY4HY77_CHIFI|nr:hypothetical protein [Chitinophaga filiformis]UPK67964.1 hypothetical protein MYF79_23715 [Chitinophaga filiformis]